MLAIDVGKGRQGMRRQMMILSALFKCIELGGTALFVTEQKKEVKRIAKNTFGKEVKITEFPDGLKIQLIHKQKLKKCSKK